MADKQNDHDDLRSRVMREWWINGGWARRENNFGHYDKGEIVHVIEKVPGSIQITREELAQVFARAYCTKENQHKQLDADIGIAMCNELFGEET